MVATSSVMLPLGTVAPEFTLGNHSPSSVSGELVRLDDLIGDAPATVVMFLSNHCPYVKHIGRELGLLTQRWLARSVCVVGVMSNDVDAYPDDAPELMTTTARSYGWDFPYLYDESQDVARAYRAACTPDFFLFDGDRRLVYRGQFDGSRPSNDIAVTGKDLHRAVSAVLAGEMPDDDQFASLGCNIKWKP